MSSSKKGNKSGGGGEPQPKWTEEDAVVADTARAIKVQNLEGLRETMEYLKPNVPHKRSSVTLQKRVNPFVHRDRMDSWELAKTIMGVIVVPIRLFGALTMLLFSILLLQISVSCGYDMTKPITGWRRALQVFANRVFFRGFLFCFGIVYISVKGKPAPSTSPWQARMVVCAPHSSFMDGFLVTYLLDVASVVAKKEAGKGLLSPVITASQSILVDRKSKSARAGALDAIIERVQSELPWRHLYLFPEGTCTNRRALINFKIGAFAPARPVQPVLLRWDKNVNFDPAWTSAGPSRTWLMYRFMCQVYTHVEVEFLPVYVPNEVEREDAGVFAAGVRAMMAKELGVPTTEHSYEDSFLAALARKRHLNPQVSTPYEFTQLQKLNGITYEDATRLLKRFTEVKRKKKNYNTPGELLQAPHMTEFDSKQIDETSDRLDLQEFAELLGLPLTEPVVEFFSYLDVTGEGSIDFPAFLVGLSFLSHNSSLEDAAKIIWATLDRDNKGAVPIRHVKKVLDLVFRRVDQRTIPLLREAKGKSSGTITYEEFLALLRIHPEYVPVALHVSSLPVEDRSQSHMSLSSAFLKLSEKEKSMKAGMDVTVKAQVGSDAEGELPERHESFQPASELAPSAEAALGNANNV